MDRPIAGGFLYPPHCHFDENRSAAKRKALLNFLFPLEGNAAKRQRVYEGKHTSNTLLLFYAGPNSTDLEAHSSMVQAIMTQTAPARCHFDRSGEISRPNSTGRIVDGDLRAQSFNRIHTPLPLYRPAAPLEMTMVRASACYFKNFRGPANVKKRTLKE